jgi:uncharacterized membrane protein YcaP (DUF421 family)
LVSPDIAVIAVSTIALLQFAFRRAGSPATHRIDRAVEWAVLESNGAISFIPK